MIQLNHNQGPWRITFDTNPDTCNLRCIMCEENSIYNKNRKSSSKRLMDFNIIQRVIEDSVSNGLKEVIPSTIGEPLLYPNFTNLLKLIRKYGLKLNLTTNGTFPKLGVDKWGELILPVASDIKISINGSTKETAEGIMNRLDFNKQLSDITRLIQLRDKIRDSNSNCPAITFQVTFLERNLEELDELLKLAITMDIDRLKGHHLWITWPELQEQSLRRNPDSIHRWNLKVRQLRDIAEKNRLKDGRKITLDNIYEISMKSSNDLIPKNWICPFLGAEAWIAWDGVFNMCCAPDSLRQTLGSYGNVIESDLMDLWNRENYRSLVKNWGSYSICKQCNMRRPPSDIKRC